MNKMKKLLLFITLLVASTAIMAQPNVSWRFNNFQLINGDTQLQFDVEVMADAPGYYFGLNTVAFDYGNAAFGASVVPASVTVDRGVLLQETYAPTLYKYNVQGVANTFAQTISASIQQVIGGPAFAAFHTEIPTTWMSFFTYTFDIAPGAAPGTMTEIVFYDVAHPGSIPLMNGQCMYIDPTGANVPYANSTVTPPGMPQLDPFDIFNFEVVPGGPTTNQWTGAIDDDWFNTGNWSLGTVPDNTTDVEIPNTGGKAPLPLISGGVAMTAAMGILSGASLGVAPDGGLETHGLFTNDGLFVIQSETLNGFAGTYIDMAGIAGTGTFEFDRGVLCSGTLPGVADPLGWHYLSAPISGLTTDDLPDYFVNEWDQASGMWNQLYVDPIAFPCTPYPTTPLPTMEAWSINFDLSYPDPNCTLPVGTGAFVEFMGAAADVHTGPYSAPLGYGATGYQMWNMVGNPYPSGLDLNSITWGSNTVQGAAFYDGCTGNYTYWTPAMGATSTAPTQGFFVETTAADNFSVDNSNRAHNADWFWKSEVSNLLTLRASGNDKSDELHVRVMDGVTTGFDMNGDFHKLFATTEGLPQIYTLAGSEELAVNAIPEAQSTPMEFVANGSGSYTIEAIEASDFSTVILENLATGETTNMLTDSYTFEYEEGTTAHFVIHFSPLGIGDNAANSVSIWSSENKVYVQTSNTDRGDIVVYNMMGQEVVRTDINPGMNIIPMDEVNTYYVVKVLTSDKAVTGKVYIK